MKSFESWKTWVGILALLLFAGAATVAGPWLLDQFSGESGTTALPPQEEELITIQLEDYLLGEVLVEAPVIKELDGVQVQPLVLAGILAMVVAAGLVAVGAPLAFIYVRLDRVTTATKEDEEFQAARSTLEQREREENKALEESQPPGAIPVHEMPLWSVISTSAIILMFVAFGGLALANTFYPEDIVIPAGSWLVGADTVVNPAVPFVGVLLLVTLLILVFVFRQPQRVEAVATDAGADERAVSWGTIWVILTGLIFLGVGTGLMMVIRSGGG